MTRENQVKIVGAISKNVWSSVLTGLKSRFYKRSETLFKSLLFWLAEEVSWLAVEVLSPCQK